MGITDKNKDSMDKREKIQKILIEFSEGDIWINKATNDILALFNFVGQSEQLCGNLDKNYNCKNMCLTHCIDGNKFWK